MSEREVAAALSASGRPISLTLLGRWRREGLLPQLENRGLGTGKGKTYYWADPDILDHATTTYDLAQIHSDPAQILRALWLSGYDVPLPQLRRAWAHHARTRPPLRPSHATGTGEGQDGFPAGFESSLSSILLSAAFVLCDATQSDDDDAEVIALVERLLSQHQLSVAAAERARARTLWRMIQTAARMAETANLATLSSDEELRQTQRYLRTFSPPVLEALESSIWPVWATEKLGTPIFLLVLVLVRRGQTAFLDHLARQAKGRQVLHPPAFAIPV